MPRSKPNPDNHIELGVGTARSAPTVFTVGHSNHPWQMFVEQLQRHRIDVLVDTRSVPRSRVAPHFDRSAIARSLRGKGIRYLYLGGELGGRPDGSEFYDERGHVLYRRVAATESFQVAISRLLTGAVRGYRIALLCAEENPLHCHRRLLVGRVLQEEGLTLSHIRRTGSAQSEAELLREAEQDDPALTQPALFTPRKDDEWTSTLSVSHRRRPPDSSER
jgi:uncharacterized protein (DUF488 family)